MKKILNTVCRYFGAGIDPSRRSLYWSFSGILFILLFLAGCTTIKIPDNGIPNPGTPTGLTGNWKFQVTTPSGTVPFTSLAGFINETSATSGSSDSVTAALQAQSTTCFLGTTLIPLQGTVKQNQLSLYSFSVVGQFVSINATEDSTDTHLSGTYSIGGGCSDGASGALTGTRYAPLTGTYSGSVTGSNPAKMIHLNLSQQQQGLGDGTFSISGSATISGFSCFTKGTLLSTESSVLGSAVNLTLSTDDLNGAQIALSGTFDPAADTVSLNSIRITGGSCAGSAGGATLTRSP